jgi:K+-transporting ATPase KdpF subunit
MWDLGCVLGSLLFFLLARAYVAGCDRLGFFLYLVYALLQAEKF